MISAPFDYEVAESVDPAIELLGTKEDAKLLAGGHSLLPLMKFRLARPATLVDIGRLSGLAGVANSGEHLKVGALTRHHDLANDPLVQEHCPILAYTATLVGDSQVRHRGTIGGSLAHGDPASDLSTIALTLDAELVARGPNGERTIPVSSFFIGPFTTALAAREVLTEIRIPKVDRGVYLKHTRRAQDWATVGVAAVVADGTTHVALASMGPTPVRARAVEDALANGAGAAEAAARAGEGTEPPSDVSGSGEYRAHLAQVYVRRALEQL